MKVYARVDVTVNGETATFALQRYAKRQGLNEYYWALEIGPEWMAEFAPDPLTCLEDIPEWARKTVLIDVATNA